MTVAMRAEGEGRAITFLEGSQERLSKIDRSRNEGLKILCKATEV